MNRSTQTLLTTVATELAKPESLCGLFHENKDGELLPSQPALAEVIDLCRSILFPGYYGKTDVNSHNLIFHIGVALERLHTVLAEQTHSADIATAFIERLPALRQTLATDVEATYLGDPAAENCGEVISCYPVIKAITNYRIAHELLLLGVPLIPRILTEMAHSETGIDIHPAATIGHHFTIDHGTGVVIGATCIIGNNVKLYQGVTLGAKSFPVDDDGNPIKGIPRHPILEDNVIVYSNATILGRITIARGTVVGGNLWVTESTEPGEQLVQAKKRKSTVVRPEDWGGL